MKKVNLYVALLLAGMFLLGALSGGAAVYIGVARKVRGILQGPPEELETRALVFALNRQLDLDETQRMQISNIVLRHQPELNATRRTIEPQLKEVRARSKDEIRAVLRAKQQAKFDLLYTQFEMRRARALGGQ